MCGYDVLIEEGERGTYGEEGQERFGGGGGGIVSKWEGLGGERKIEGAEGLRVSFSPSVSCSKSRFTFYKHIT